MIPMETIHTGAATAPSADNLYDLCSALDCATAELKELFDAFYLLGEQMEDEGLQRKGSFEDWRAINFAHRFHLHYSTFNVLIHELGRITQELCNTSDQAFTAYIRQRKGATADES